MRWIAVLLVAIGAFGCRAARSPLPPPSPPTTTRPDGRTTNALPAAGEKRTEKEQLTLDEAYRLALERSETLALDMEELSRIQSLYEQAFGSVLPRLSFKGTYTRQDPSEGAGGGSFAQNFSLTQRTEFKFVAKQPLFSGLREFYAMRQARASSGAKEDAVAYARLLLYVDVAEAFTSVLRSGRALITVRDSLRLGEERLEELRARRRVGITRQTEVLAQEAEVASTRAQAEDLRRARALAGEALNFLTGLRVEREIVDTLPEPSAAPPPIEKLLAGASKKRHDLRALEQELAAAGESIGVARAGYYPTVSLEGNGYTRREGNNDDVAWDLTLTGEMPIFDGATTQARVREARSRARSAQLQLDRRRREVELEVRNARAEVEAFQAQLASREKAVESATESHELVQAEYRRDIATNIEVLTAFTTLQQARLQLDRTRFEWKLAGVRLEAACGRLPEETTDTPK